MIHERWVLQPGSQQIAAGYVVYGSSTILVYSAGNGVHGFTLDPSVGAYVLSHPNITMPQQGKYYSVNEAYRDSFPPRYCQFIDRLRSGALGHKYASRYIGSMVADMHRTLLKGGVFLYPPTEDSPQGKLRLLYEANPLAFLVEQAGGRALDGQGRVLDVQPRSIHQRIPLATRQPGRDGRVRTCRRARRRIDVISRRSQESPHGNVANVLRIVAGDRALPGCSLRAMTAAAEGYRVGVAKVDITPDYPIRLNGFGSRRAESEGVTQRIWAKALAIRWRTRIPDRAAGHRQPRRAFDDGGRSRPPPGTRSITSRA